MTNKILRLPDIVKLTGLSGSTIYNRIRDGVFPTSVSLGGRSVGWVASEVDEWIEGQIKSSRIGASKVKGAAS
jgi:prophage regulatory protein